MTPAELRTFIGKHVRILRDGREDGVGTLISVDAGEMYQGERTPNDEPIMVPVEDYSLTFAPDDPNLENPMVAGRRHGNVWTLEEVPE